MKSAIVTIGILGAAASIYALFLHDRNSVQAGNDSIRQSVEGSTGVIQAGRDVNVAQSRTAQFEFVSWHDGAGAPILTEPSMSAYITAARGPFEGLLGRVSNNTGLSVIETVQKDKDGYAAGFHRVRVEEGPLKGKVGWTLQRFVRRPE